MEERKKERKKYRKKERKKVKKKESKTDILTERQRVRIADVELDKDRRQLTDPGDDVAGTVQVPG